MSIDLSEFHDIFFEECGEGLDVMESGLLTLDHGTDVEEINSIFRAAHSIKGGAGSFGFMAISSFTHVLETLLDEMRDGRRSVSTELVDLLLGSVDVLRGMVDAARAEEALDEARISEAQGKLEAVLANAEAPAPLEASEPDNGVAIGFDDDSATEGAEEGVAISFDDPEATQGVAISFEDDIHSDQTSESPVGKQWHIRFAPHADMLKTGNEPIRIIRALSLLGELRVETDTQRIPALEQLVHNTCYLSWNMYLNGEVEECQIAELFDWVIDDSDLEIIRLDDDTTTEQTVEDTVGASTDSTIDSTVDSTVDSTMTESQSAETAAPNSDAAAPETATAEQAGTVTSIKPAAAQANEADGKPPSSEKKSGAGTKESGSLRVATDKVDDLINLVGELVITQSMLGQIGAHLEDDSEKAIEKLRDGLDQLERNTRQLQESVLQIRMLPISFAFSRYPRVVRDISNKLGKKIELKLIGEGTEVDKTVLEKIGDPLVHLIRNSLDHGIEIPEIRKAAGKPETGTLTLSASHEGGDIIIKVIDDGAGLNRDRILSKAIERGLVSEGEELSDDRIHNLIFAPGFSTAEAVSDVSGRGVGMDVVRRNVRDLGGNVSIQSNDGAGSTVIIRLPLTLAILDGQLVRVGDETYIVSLNSIVESLQMSREHIHSVTECSHMYRLRDEYIPIVEMNTMFGGASGDIGFEDGLLTVVESEGKRYGLVVDDLMGQQQVVIKSLETNFRQIPGISGATILGDGTVALIIDIPGLMQRFQDQTNQRKPALFAVA